MPSVNAALRATKHLNVFGDTDIFPTLPEMKCFADRAEAIAERVSALTVGEYRPGTALEFLTPKSSMGYRISHQLSAADSLIYLASLIECAPALEGSRLPEEEGSAFSYRFQEGDGPRLFTQGASYHDWIIKLTTFAESDEPFASDPLVIVTDISDFYQRIYFHRIENVFSDAGADDRSFRLIKKLLQSVRALQSFGIPVGSAASRLIAESVLSDTDKFLRDKGLRFTRFVDDFRIIVSDEKEAHSFLCQLAEHLMTTEGLSLNASKTYFDRAASVRKSSQVRLDDVFTNKHMREFENYLRLTYGDDDLSEDEDEDDVADSMFLDANDLVGKIKELDEYGAKDMSIFKAILKAIRIVGGVDPSLLLEHYSQFLYFIPREFCLALSKMDKDSNEKVVSAKETMLKLLSQSPFRDLQLARYWILDLFVRGVLPFTWDDFRDYDFNRSVVERRAEYFLRGRLGDTAFFRRKKAQFAEVSDWEKPALLLGAMCLPRDEYAIWIRGIKDNIPGPFSDIFSAWLVDNRDKLTEILDY